MYRLATQLNGIACDSTEVMLLDLKAHFQVKGTSDLYFHSGLLAAISLTFNPDTVCTAMLLCLPACRSPYYNPVCLPKWPVCILATYYKRH